jgi:hypothetical protein
MGRPKINDDNIVAALMPVSGVLLGVLVACGAIFGTLRFAGSILAGGLLALVNFAWLAGALKKVLQLPAAKAERFAQLRYVMRLAAMGVLLYVLIVRVGIDIIGLLIGLSVLVISIVGLALYKLTFKGGL